MHVMLALLNTDKTMDINIYKHNLEKQSYDITCMTIPKLNSKGKGMLASQLEDYENNGIIKLHWHQERIGKTSMALKIDC